MVSHVFIKCPHWLGHKTYFAKLREAQIQFSSQIEMDELSIKVKPEDEKEANRILIDCLSGKYINVSPLPERLKPFVTLGWDD